MQEVRREKCIFFVFHAPYTKILGAQIGIFIHFSRPIYDSSHVRMCEIRSSLSLRSLFVDFSFPHNKVLVSLAAVFMCYARSNDEKTTAMIQYFFELYKFFIHLIVYVLIFHLYLRTKQKHPSLDECFPWLLFTTTLQLLQHDEQ